jgi:RNA polymerase sigma factor (sigma-70 family)
MGSTVNQLTQARPRRTEVSDGDLLASVAAGDLSCLGLLFDRYAVDVGRFIARLGTVDGDVDDLVQATFLLVPKAASSFRGGDVRAWLLGVATNLVRRHRRSLARLAARIAAWACERRPNPPTTPGQALEASEDATRAKRALARLSQKKREVFVLIALEGVSAEEAAATLGIPVGTVWTRLHHARRELRARLAGEED